jgi:H+/Cl- antiporter ClcA
MADAAAPPDQPDPSAIVRSRSFVALLVIAAAAGLVVSLAAWGFLELVHQIQTGVFTDLPKDLGYDHGAPMWWYLVALALSGLLVAAAIEWLPGTGGHIPAHGLQMGGGIPNPVELPGVVLAALATIGLGVVLGPEAPLIALGGGLAVLSVQLVRRDAPDQLLSVIASSGSFAALAMIFGSPLIAAIILIEAAGLSRERLPLILLPGLLAAGIGSLVSIGMGSWTGLSTSDYALPTLSLPDFARPDLTDFAWTIPLAIAIAIGIFAIFLLARGLVGVASSRRFLVLPAAGLVIACLGIAFHATTDHGVNQVLFSGQEALAPLVANPGAWSLSALALVIAFKGLAYGVSLSGFRGGPIFPALFLGAAAGIMAARLPGFETTPAVAVGIGAATTAALRLPLAGVVLATLLTQKAGLGSGPLIIVGVVVAYVTTQLLDGLQASKTATGGEGKAAEEPAAGAAAAT